MNMEINKDFLSSLDRRVSDHDTKIANTQRDYTELGHEIKELLNRINNGVSPSVNEVRKENSEIKLAIANIDHEFKIGMMEMRNMVKGVVDGMDLKVHNFEVNEIAPMRRDMNRIQTVLFYGLVGALIVFAGQKVLGNAWDKFFEKPKVESIADLKASPMKR
jgi:hypothetical protein